MVASYQNCMCILQAAREKTMKIQFNDDLCDVDGIHHSTVPAYLLSHIGIAQICCKILIFQHESTLRETISNNIGLCVGSLGYIVGFNLPSISGLWIRFKHFLGWTRKQ